MSVTVGIDVGGPAKGFHAVACVATRILATYHSLAARGIVDWALEFGVHAVGIDAPSQWSSDGRPRSAERELTRNGMPCFASPTLQQAVSHPKNYYAWMINGISLYRAFEPTHPRYAAGYKATQAFSVETFPHATACALSGKILSARHKASVRRDTLRRAGMDCGLLKSIDYVDAALCALAAYSVVLGEFDSYGNATDGIIVTPRREPHNAAS